MNVNPCCCLRRAGSPRARQTSSSPPRPERAEANASQTASQRLRIGSASVRMAMSRATISDSEEECETTVCFLQIAVIGASAFDPTNASKLANVDLLLFVSSANDASL